MNVVEPSPDPHGGRRPGAVVRCIGLSPVERISRSRIIPSVAYCRLLVAGGEEKVCTFFVDEGDAAYVAQNSRMGVGDSAGHPDGTGAGARLPVESCPENLHDPGFRRIGYGKGFTVVGAGSEKAVALRQASYQENCVPGRSAALQCNDHELLHRQNGAAFSWKCFELVLLSDGGFSYGKLMFVKTGVGGSEKGVGFRSLGNSSQFDRGQRFVAEQAVVDGNCRSLGMFFSRNHSQV